MKAETVSHEVLPHFLSSFESLVKCNYNAEVHRSLALFITYTLHTAPSSLPERPNHSLRPAALALLASREDPALDTNGSGPSTNAKFLTRKQLGTKILEMYTRLLCEKGDLSDIRRFARTVTNKVTNSEPMSQRYLLTPGQWLLYLLTEDDPEVVVYGCKILARLLVTHGSSYTAKFGSKTGGFWIMAQRLKHGWDIPTLWPIVFCILFEKTSQRSISTNPSTFSV